MKYTTYILYSRSLGRYYTGSTSMPIKERLRRHNSNHKGYTGKASDWELIHKEEFTRIEESRKKEKQIINRGAKRYLHG